MLNKSKKKIAVCDLVSDFGGIQKVMTYLLPELSDQFDFYVVDPYANQDYIKKLSEVNIRTYFNKSTVRKTFIGGQGTWKRKLKMVAAIPRLLRVRDMFAKAICDIAPDYIYANQLNTLRLLMTIRRLRRLPIIYHSHGHAGNSILNDASVRVINSWADVVIPVSQSTADFLLRAGVRPELIHICHNAIPVEEIKRSAQLPPSRPLPGKHLGQVVFLLPAFIQHTKGQHLAVEALAKVVKRGYDVALWLAGNVTMGGNKKYVQELNTAAENLHVEHIVYFLGWRDDIYQVMAAADVIMLCSLTESESFGLVLAEGMVLGKPCIGANIGGMPEVIKDKHTGLLFTPGSSDSLAGVMMLLAADANMREEFGRRGRKRAEELFAVGVQAKRISGIIKAIAV